MTWIQDGRLLIFFIIAWKWGIRHFLPIYLIDQAISGFFGHVYNNVNCRSFHMCNKADYWSFICLVYYNPGCLSCLTIILTTPGMLSVRYFHSN